MAKDKPEFNEIATVGAGRDITQLWMGPLQQSQDTVLTTQGGSGYTALTLYEELHRDDQVASCFQQRRLAVVSREWDVRPGRRRFMSPTAQDEKAAEFIREMIDTCLEFDDLTSKMHFGALYGYGIGEVLYAQDGRYTIWDDTNQGIKAKKARRFDFTPEGELRLLTLQDSWQGEALPPKKFWHLTFGGDNDDFHKGLGLGYQLFWPVYFKKGGMQAWLKFLEKAGIPSRVGKYPTGASKSEQDRLLDACWAIGSDSATIIPDGMTIDLLESARTVADFTSLYDKMNEAIAKVILNQTFTSDGLGGQYKGDNLLIVRNEVAKSDADLICQSFNRGPVKWLIEYNRSALGEDVAVPQVWRDMSESPNLNEVADTWTKLYNMDYDPGEAEVRATFGDHWRKRPPPDTPSTLPVQPGGSQPPPELAAAVESDTIDVYVGRLRNEVGGEVDGWLARIEQELENAEDLGNFADRLYSLYPELSSEQFAQVLGDALTASHLAGFYESQLDQEEE